MFQRTAAAVLTLTMLLSTVPLTALASEIKTPEEINRENAAAYAVSFVDVVYENPGLDAGNVIPFYDENDNLSGYCVDIVDGSQPNGYVIIKFLDGEQTVSEFAVEPGVQNPFDQIAEEENISQDDVAYYSVGLTDYQIVDTDSNAVYGFESEESTVSQFQATKQQVQHQQELYAQEAGLDGGSESYSTNALIHTYIVNNYSGTRKSSGTLPIGSTTFYTETYVKNTLGKTYACTVTAMCNLMRYYYSRGYTKIDGNISTMYDRLWNLANTNSQGSTWFPSASASMRNYLSERGYAVDCAFSLSPGYDYYTNAVNSSKASLLGYNVSVDNGHTVFVVGYVETTTGKYLAVKDGWNTQTRYYVYDKGGVTNMGITVQILY